MLVFVLAITTTTEYEQSLWFNAENIYRSTEKIQNNEEFRNVKHSSVQSDRMFFVGINYVRCANGKNNLGIELILDKMFEIFRSTDRISQ